MPWLLSTNTDLNTISFVWLTKTSLSKGWPTLDRCLLGIILLKVRVITLRGPITPYRPMGTSNNTVESTWIVFSRQLAFQKISEIGLKDLGPSIETLADAEGLYAHKNAVSLRLKDLT